MAEYITREELEQRFTVAEIAQLLDDDGDESESAAESDSLVTAIADASNLIDGYLAGRYDLPLATVPDLVKGWAANIARFNLWADKAPEEVRRRYDDALAQLKDLAKGIISLPPDAAGEAVPGGAVNVESWANCRVFTEDTLAGF